MSTKAKIRIYDSVDLRDKIDYIYEASSQIQLAKWSLSMARHILKTAGIEYCEVEEIKEGFDINKQWQLGKCRMHDVRQAGFAVNRIAKECKSELRKTALRATVQAIGSGHMKEHAMVASDYCIKVINIMYPDNIDEVIKEREWQHSELIKIISNNP